jgi:CheY-like chemotaxis protein
MTKEGFMAGPKRILIVDDEQDIRTYLSTLLGDQGYETIQAKDGGEAMQKIQAGPPDLITLDISMPEKSGIRFFREIKTDDRWKHIPIIVVTGVSEDIKTFISSRHHVPAPEGFVPKPINQEEILGLVHSLLK